MHFEKRSHWSGQLGREMGFNKYGHAGKPVIVFPSSGGSQDEFADFGMIETIANHIDAGRLTVYTPSSIDSESWLAEGKSGHNMAKAHNQYDKYIISEFLPLIRHESQWGGKIMATGCSMGGFHAVNFGLRHPDVFDVVIAMSGVYDARFFTGDFGDDMVVYENSPIDYLNNMTDAWFLDQYRQNHYIVAVGQGNWEGPHIEATRQLESTFANKAIPGWFDYWGHDVPHDWPAWRQQFPYFVNNLVGQGIL
ncbi:transposase [Aerococcus urinaehominis]|uniref:Transposase n=1 Tax=Aerococcus urinaehominis TaxID=128944 RepID=A0A109RG89_9LACT|nr:alpha/beta hydrolase-fold protein [Aerococcus urinaehominis]AMB98771.1 transposase [Aerococcus urinaehominis]SDM13256.1 Esterase/lipase superfamily enzyme [Aerococcus urinaehominis]